MVNIETGTYLDTILRNTELELGARKQTTPQDVLIECGTDHQPVDMISALREPGTRVISEFKRASPSKGPIAPDATVEQIVTGYLAGGCAAISVLTDERFFQGSLQDLETVSQMAHANPTPRPVLRKDFVIDSYQIDEARAHGADAVLLIVAALDDATLQSLIDYADQRSLTPLVEVHDEREMERALATSAALIGINNRNLRTFEVDLATTERLAPLVPSNITLVGESGIHTREDVERLEAAGVHAVLVGESLMRQSDQAEAVRRLTS